MCLLSDIHTHSYCNERRATWGSVSCCYGWSHDFILSANKTESIVDVMEVNGILIASLNVVAAEGN